MISYTTAKFWKLYSALPTDMRKQAKTAYSQFENNPYHPSLQFKRVHSNKPVYSVRINIDYRAVGIVDDAEIIWFWIGSHSSMRGLRAKAVNRPASCDHAVAACGEASNESFTGDGKTSLRLSAYSTQGQRRERESIIQESGYGDS